MSLKQLVVGVAYYTIIYLMLSWAGVHGYKLPIFGLGLVLCNAARLTIEKNGV